MDKKIDGETLVVSVNPRGMGLDFHSSHWKDFGLEHATPCVQVDGTDAVLDQCEVNPQPDNRAMDLKFSGSAFEIRLRFELLEEDVLRMRSRARNLADKDVSLTQVGLLKTNRLSLGKSPPSHVIVLEEGGNYSARIVSLVDEAGKEDRLGQSANFWLAYDRDEKKGLLVGFETSQRWMGQITSRMTPAGMIKEWGVGFDGGDLVMAAGEEIELENVLFLIGDDPWRLLESYGAAVQAYHKIPLPAKPSISWCSWFPYRLGVTEDRVLETAKAAVARLKPLGLSIIQVDLGWEKDQLPSTFEENAQFAHGLKWLSGQLNKLGFKLGVWKAPYTISEFDELAKIHPEWLVGDEKGQPAPYWTWFWKPHGKVFILDLTHPGAQQWLRDKINSLRERGVAYLKTDFIGCFCNPIAKRRHDKRIVSGGGCEAARIGAEIIRQALPDALILNCGGPEMPGKGQWPLLYACGDTGNTGFIRWEFHRDNFLSLACHLFKNHRWGILQPSCLCVGMPGTLDEARLRATIAFMTGGQIDISDNLLNLPEERWQVLTKTLPPLGITARVVDLFEPLASSVFDYSITSTSPEKAKKMVSHAPGCVWHMRVDGGWDNWDLVGIFEFETPFGQKSEGLESGNAAYRISRFCIPFERLSLNPREKYWAYEFWSNAFLGIIPGREKNPHDYVHPGDYQNLVAGDAPGLLDIAFFGPGAKLVCLRKVRPHPWIVGTSFHQSVGTELRHVHWDEKRQQLSGELHRPAGESGCLVLACADKHVVSANVAGHPVVVTATANGSACLPVVTGADITRWSVEFK